MQLHGFWRSSATWRVRIALAHKRLAHTYLPVDLIAGAQHDPAFRRLNPMGQVPLLVLDDGATLSQSVAILELLEELHPDPPLLPRAPLARARVRELTELVNAGIQPLQNTAVRLHVERLGLDARAWIVQFVRPGLHALEQLAQHTAGRFCVGDQLSFADLALVPQLYFARRFAIDIDAFPTLRKIESECEPLECFRVAHADRQPDFPVLTSPG